MLPPGSHRVLERRNARSEHAIQLATPRRSKGKGVQVSQGVQVQSYQRVATANKVSSGVQYSLANKMTKLTKRSVDAVHPGENDVWLWDEELRGFGLRVKPSGVKSYLIQYRTAQGATRRYTIGRHGVVTPDEARKLARQALAATERGEDPSAQRRAERAAPRMDILLDRYVDEHVKVHNQASTAAEVCRLVERQIRPTMGGLIVRSVTRSDVMSLHRRMSDTPRQANFVLSILSKLFNLAEAWDLRPQNTNPCRHAERYSENRRERFLSEDELQRVGTILKSMDDKHPNTAVVTNAIKLLALSGCRLGEIRRLTWENVNFERGTIALPNTKTGPRNHVIGKPALALLENIERTKGSPWVFPGTDISQPLQGGRLEKAWQKIRKAAGIEDVRLHDLRHTVGTFSSQAGANAFLIRDKLGHTTLSMTSRYVNQDSSPLRELSDKVESRIAAAMMGAKTAADAW